MHKPLFRDIDKTTIKTKISSLQRRKTKQVSKNGGFNLQTGDNKTTSI